MKNSVIDQMLCDPHLYQNEKNNIFEYCIKCGYRHYKYYKTYIDTYSGIEFMYIHGGSFMMGSSDKHEHENEYPQHNVTVSSFWIGIYLVTQAQWQAVIGNNPSDLNGANRPVETVSWNACQEFITALNNTEEQQKLFRLPSEAEWEYACRAGTTTPYFFGDADKLDQYAWYKENSHRQTQPVGLLLPNDFGIYDMLGNVWEWCADAWHDKYNGAPDDGSIWENLGDTKVNRLLRGGSWYFNTPDFLRCAYRFGYDPGNRDRSIGVRVVMSNRGETKGA